MFRKILVATDLFPGSEPAMHTALELARRVGASVVALYVSEPPYEARHWFTTVAAREAELYRELAHREQEEARAQLEQQLKRVRGDSKEAIGVEMRVIAGVPADAILEQATRLEADLIVIGTHGRRGVSHALLGSIAERVVRTATVPVLTIRSQGR